MKKIQTKKVLETLDGEPLKMGEGVLTIGKVIEAITSNYQGQAFKGDPLKALEIARRFHDREEVEIDGSDFQGLIQAVRENKQFTALVLGQIIEAFNEAKDSNKDEKKT